MWGRYHRRSLYTRAGKYSHRESLYASTTYGVEVKLESSQSSSYSTYALAEPRRRTGFISSFPANPCEGESRFHCRFLVFLMVDKLRKARRSGGLAATASTWMQEEAVPQHPNAGYVSTSWGWAPSQPSSLIYFSFPGNYYVARARSTQELLLLWLVLRANDSHYTERSVPRTYISRGLRVRAKGHETLGPNDVVLIHSLQIKGTKKEAFVALGRSPGRDCSLVPIRSLALPHLLPVPFRPIRSFVRCPRSPPLRVSSGPDLCE